MIRMEAVYQNADVYSENADQKRVKEKDSKEMEFINNYTKIESDFIKCFWPVF